uniref:Uncharacterized protein n=1 Tax=Anguilla anguilla TaxID=7936 RepID=A0A0E9RBQ3_ANGAN
MNIHKLSVKIDSALMVINVFCQGS